MPGKFLAESYKRVHVLMTHGSHRIYRFKVLQINAFHFNRRSYHHTHKRTKFFFLSKLGWCQTFTAISWQLNE